MTAGKVERIRAQFLMLKSMVWKLVHRLLVLERAVVGSMTIGLSISLILIKDLNASGRFLMGLLKLLRLQQIDNLTDVTLIICAFTTVMETITDAIRLVL